MSLDQEQQVIPPLLTLQRTKKETPVQINTDEQDRQKAMQPLNIFRNEGTKNQTNQTNKKNTQMRSSELEREKERQNQQMSAIISEFDSRFKVNIQNTLKKEDKDKLKSSGKWQDIQKSKKLIDQILNKINFQKITEEAYPVSNETIGELTQKMDEQICSLQGQEERKANSLALNPNNQFVKRQLQVIKSSLNKARTIKQLYIDKIAQRNKIMALEQNIIGLKDQNVNLKLRITRGIETIQNHMHNLPCEKEKELKQELDRVYNDWVKERQMRQNLEHSISVMVINFKRLFDQAEQARRIVVNQLKEVQIKEKNLISAATPQSQGIASQKNTPDLSVLGLEDRVKRSQKVTDIKDYFPSSSQRTPQKVSKTHKDTSSMRMRDIDQPLAKVFSMQEQIQKMRNNQLTIKKYRF